MIKLVISLVIFFSCGSAYSHDSKTCRTKRPSEIIQVFDKGIMLNEKFKKTVGGGEKDESQRLRKEIEQYDEEAVMPCVRRAPQIMAKRVDKALMHKLMELVISYENSADETISYSMGKLFSIHPAAVERELNEFPPARRKIIANSVQTGWINVQPELSPALGKNRDERLKKMLASLNSN